MMTPSRVIQETARMRTNQLIDEAHARRRGTDAGPARRRSAWGSLAAAIRTRRTTVRTVEPQTQAAPCG